jgi:hypothetical protein
LEREPAAQAVSAARAVLAAPVDLEREPAAQAVSAARASAVPEE